MSDEMMHGKDNFLEVMKGKNLVLIGMRGSGKSTIGPLLKVATGMRFVDTDDEVIEDVRKEIGEKLTVAEIVKRFTLEGFRDRESKVLQRLSYDTGAIIATGGGAVVRPQNREFLKKNSICVWLQASKTDLVKRTGSDPNRLPLTDQKTPEGEVEKVMTERKPLYTEVADETVDTMGKSEDATAKEIYHLIEKRKKSQNA